MKANLRLGNLPHIFLVLINMQQYFMFRNPSTICKVRVCPIYHIFAGYDCASAKVISAHIERNLIYTVLHNPPDVLCHKHKSKCIKASYFVLNHKMFMSYMTS